MMNRTMRTIALLMPICLLTFATSATAEWAWVLSGPASVW